ncbi:TNT domain-containing protein [Saccharomonospora sp. NB11]|uniref:TNT domain-containing protein n=1 Tax=Saccharomonospora sp. NB11 TaxID=1642298 RepID=UPI0018D0D3F9|nr:TNT domain-containing protein [Saccharomonospora sp. NB11]
MRYRVEVADRPDALYALWDGRIFHAKRSTADNTVLLVVCDGEDAPEGFDATADGRPAKVVPAQEAPATFALHTYCLYDDEPYRIEPHSTDAELTLRWDGTDEAMAAALGLTGFSTTTDDPDALTALWQERHDFAEENAPRSEPGSGDADVLLRAVGQTLRSFLPAGWQRVAAQFRQLGDFSELEVKAVADDVVVSLSAPPALGQLFAQLRSAMYTPDEGTWFQGTYTLDSAGNFDFDYDSVNEPAWRLGPDERRTAASYDVELRYYPRQSVPDWLAAKAGLPLDVRFRHARVVDGHAPGEKPVVNRAPVPQEQVRDILNYLYRAPVVHTKPGPLPDLFVPGPPNVPDAFHTDGTWIWPAAVPHYLRKYGVPPEPELLDHIRAAGFTVPYVEPQVRATAEADVLGAPRPPRSTHDVAKPDPVALVARGEEPPRPLRASEVLRMTRQRLTELGVAETAYRLGDSADGAWCLRRTDRGWELARHADGGPVDPRYFSGVQEAAEALVGALLLFPGRAAPTSEPAEGPDAAAHATDWPILPLRGEPPLPFLTRKRLLRLPAGAVVDRFGNDAGNLVHPENTPFAQTALTLDREFARRRYRVVRPIGVLAGVLRPWGPLPGGGLGYLLPRPIAQHVESGALEALT